jgi:hypothetical protein
MAEQWNHPEEYPRWRIGPFMFAARRYNGGWIYWGLLHGYEVLEEDYLEGNIEAVQYVTKKWAIDWLSIAIRDTQEFQP